MGHAEENHSIIETSDDTRVMDSGNDTINPFLLQMLKIFANPTSSTLWTAIPNVMYAIGLIANVLLIYYILHHKRHQSSIFALILCLGICDLSTCAAVIFQDNVYSSMYKSGYLCVIGIFFAYSASVSTAYHLVAISVIRFYQLVYPLSARANITPSLCFKMSFIVWTLAAAYATPFARYYLWIIFPYNGYLVTMCFYTGDPFFREACISIVYMVLPTFLIVLFHVAKHCIVTQQNAPQSDGSVSGQDSKRQTTDTRAVMIVITFAIISNLPSIIHRGMHGIFGVPYLKQHLYIMHGADKINFSSSIINPFIYTFASASVRADFKAMFQKRGTV